MQRSQTGSESQSSARRKLSLTVATTLLGLVGSSQLVAQGDPPKPRRPRIAVAFGSEEAAAAARSGNYPEKDKIVWRTGYLGAFDTVEVPSNKVSHYETLLAALPEALYAELESSCEMFGDEAIVNDPDYVRYQWNLHDRGLERLPAATSWMGIDCDTVHKFVHCDGSIMKILGEGATVAVLDTGVARIDDLANVVWGDSYDFVEEDYGDPMAKEDYNPDDENGHGTHVIGTIAQTSNNGLGCAGIAPLAKIMAIRVLDKRGRGTDSQLANGIRWAVDHGADIINLSLGYIDRNVAPSVVAHAIQDAHAAGVVICAAAGNQGTNWVSFPASMPECIAVGATDFSGTRAKYSQYGDALDVVAPGGDMDASLDFVGNNDGIFQQTFRRSAPSEVDSWPMAGTSTAAAHATGVCALIKSAFIHYTEIDIRNALLSNCTDRGAPGKDDEYGNGLISAYLSIARSGYPIVPLAPSHVVWKRHGSNSVDVSWVRESYNGAGFTVELSEDGGRWLSVASVSDLDLRCTLTGLYTETPYLIRVRAYNSTGLSIAINEIACVLKDNGVPDAPWNLKLKQKWTYNADITWEDRADNESNIRVALSSNGIDYHNVAMLPQNSESFRIDDLRPLTKYYVKVRASRLEVGFSDYSNIIEFTTDDVVPADPTNLSMSDVWAYNADGVCTDHADNETAFEWYISSDGVNFTLDGTTVPNDTKFRYKNLSPRRTYWVKCRAVNAVGASGYTNVVQFTTDDVVPADPTDCDTKQIWQYNADIIWTDHADNEDEFKVYLSTDNVTYTCNGSNAPDDTKYRLKNLNSKTTYWVKVLAANEVGDSGYSNTKQFTTK